MTPHMAAKSEEQAHRYNGWRILAKISYSASSKVNNGGLARENDSAADHQRAKIISIASSNVAVCAMARLMKKMKTSKQYHRAHDAGGGADQQRNRSGAA